MIDITNLFANHHPNENQLSRMTIIRETAYQLAELIQATTLPSAEQTLAIRALHQVVFHANSAIVLNEPAALSENPTEEDNSPSVK